MAKLGSNIEWIWQHKLMYSDTGYSNCNKFDWATCILNKQEEWNGTGRGWCSGKHQKGYTTSIKHSFIRKSRLMSFQFLKNTFERFSYLRFFAQTMEDWGRAVPSLIPWSRFWNHRSQSGVQHPRLRLLASQVETLGHHDRSILWSPFSTSEWAQYNTWTEN